MICVGQSSDPPQAKTECIAQRVFINSFNIRSEEALWPEFKWLGILIGVVKDAPAAIINGELVRTDLTRTRRWEGRSCLS